MANNNDEEKANGVPDKRSSTLYKAVTPFRLLGRGLVFWWKWSVPYRSANRKIDPEYAAIWNTPVDDEHIRATLSSLFPDIPREDLPTDEEDARRLIRERLPPPPLPESEIEALQQSEKGRKTLAKRIEEQRKASEELPEEAWKHLPANVQNLLASWNAHHLERKIDILISEGYHPRAGSASITRSRKGVQKTFRMWRRGFREAVSTTEFVGVQFFIPFLAFMACYPDVAAGFLGERSYNQRSVGSRIATLCQLFSLWRFPYHSIWLLFNWSLERLLGALVGNTIYALSAVVPALNRVYETDWFRFTLLGLSMSWQVGVQFTPTLRDYINRLITRRQMTRLRHQTASDESIIWVDVDTQIDTQLTSLKTYISQQQHNTPPSDVPFKVRTERFIKFTASFPLGRPLDQLIGLLKDDLENIVNTYEDYERSALPAETSASRDQGHTEPRTPKFILVVFDIALFAYINYSFWPEPFTFNTTVAYGLVVCLKQAVLAFKKYQTIKSARRLFTNMVSFNLLGVFLVSTPVTVNREVLAPPGNFAALLLAMVFATLFLAEPIAPLLLKGTEWVVVAWGRAFGRGKKKEEKKQETGDGEQGSVVSQSKESHVFDEKESDDINSFDEGVVPTGKLHAEVTRAT